MSHDSSPFIHGSSLPAGGLPTGGLSTAGLSGDGGFIVGVTPREGLAPASKSAQARSPQSDLEAVDQAKAEHEAANLFMRQVRGLVKDLLEPKAWIYWTDLLTSLVVGQTAFFFFSLPNAPAYVRVAAFIVAVFAFYRVTTFTHELSHFRKGTFRGFRATWNALVGIPFMLPAFLYEDHRLHHVNHSYGTQDDSEYLPLASGTAWDLTKYFLKIFLVPVLGIIRFMILTPLSWLSPSWRRWTWERSSSALAINWSYRRSPEDESDHPLEVRIMEICCFAYGYAFFALILTGLMPWSVFFNFYAVFLCVALVNYVRTLGAHRYQGIGEPMSYVDQILDSYTIAGQDKITGLMAPLGMRYHALHHLVPSLPYHNMAEAHRRLVAGLPADSPYHRTIRRSIWQAAGEVMRSVRELPKGQRDYIATPAST